MKETIHSILQTFRPLKNRDICIYLSGHTISMLGTGMQMTAQSWVVWNLSDSTSVLGLTIMLNFLPMLLLGAFAGVWADKIDRRKLLIATQLSSMVLAFVFASLVQFNTISIFHIYILAFLLGCVVAIEMPAQTALIGDLSGIDQVRAAVTLNNMIRQISRSVGPALAGMAMGTLGIAPTFWINGTSFVAAIAALLVVRTNQISKDTSKKDKGGIREAFYTIMNQARIQDLLFFSACVPFFAISAVGLIPAIVTDYLQEGPETLGLIQGAAGAGALFGSLIILPIVQKVEKVGKLLIVAIVWIGLWYSAVAYSTYTWIWIVGIFVGNALTPVVLTTAVSLLQILSPVEMKARILGIWMMISFGTQPFGAVLIGFIGDGVGTPTAIFMYGMSMVIIGAGMLFFRKGLYDWNPMEEVKNSKLAR